MKICSRKDCPFNGELQSEKNFSKDERRKSKLQPCCKSCFKIYCKINEDKTRIQRKQYREKHKDDIRQKAKLWRATHKSQSFGYRLSRLLTCAKRRAKDKKLNFSIDLDFMKDLFLEQEGKCKLSGID